MHIAVITGGSNSEREVSLASARNVARALSFASAETLVFPEAAQEFLDRRGQFDVVIPVIHGVGGEDGTLQGLLEGLGLPYLFSGIRGHAIAIDKQRAKDLVQEHGIRVPRSFTAAEAEFPCFAKPRYGGSSFRTDRFDDRAALREFLDGCEEEMMVEAAVPGREFTVGVIDRPGRSAEALPVVEIRPPGTFFDYESKYDRDKLAEEICPAEIDGRLAADLQRTAGRIHRLLEARHLTRSDFIVSPEGDIVYLETNTIPGLTDTSLVPKALKEAGQTLAGLLQVWCEEVTG